MYSMIKGNLENKNNRLYRHFNDLETDIDSFLLIFVVINTAVLFIVTYFKFPQNWINNDTL